MGSSLQANTLQRCRRLILLLTIVVFVLISSHVRGQTSSTGSLTGSVFDPSGAVLPGAVVRLTNLVVKLAQLIPLLLMERAVSAFFSCRPATTRFKPPRQARFRSSAVQPQTSRSRKHLT